jgi:hypothetical protein
MLYLLAIILAVFASGTAFGSWVGFRVTCWVLREAILKQRITEAGLRSLKDGKSRASQIRGVID